MLEAIAKASFISPFHFHRIFKSITNSTPREYMERIRIEKAAHLIQYTNLGIGDIAYDVGYENHESFSKVFKKYLGQRRRNTKENSNPFLQRNH